jgi:hypothetical protein
MREGSPEFDVLVMSNYDYIEETDECVAEEAAAAHHLEEDRPTLSNFE